MNRLILKKQTYGSMQQAKKRISNSSTAKRNRAEKTGVMDAFLVTWYLLFPELGLIYFP